MVKIIPRPHKLEKTEKGWKCSVCSLSWKRKPTSSCVGIPSIDWNDKPENSYWDEGLEWYNLRIKPGAFAIAYRQKSQHRKYYCYKREDLEKINPNIPDLIVSKKEKDNLGYLTENQLNKKHLKPLPEARTLAVAYLDDDKYVDFCVFYHPEDTEFSALDIYLCKSTLKKTYLLSASWIKKLGEPDKTVQHDIYKSDIYLYSRQRVENFLAQNAEKYSNWLDKREEMVARAVPLIEQTKKMKRQQKKCLSCGSSIMMDNGLFCAVHPLGLEKHQIPCPDWTQRQES